MIEIEGLTKAFGSKVAVDNLTLTVPTGRLFAFLGPNGAGKTTTIKLLAGLLHPTSGRMRVCGHDVVAEPQEVKRVVSYVPDQPFLYDKLSGREFLDFVAEMYGIPRKEYRKKAAELIELFEMESYLDELSEGYSHGMRQRVVLSAALLHEPRVLIVDEPMVGLDPKTIRLTKDIFRAQAARGVTLFMSTHTLAIAEELADDIAIINHGRLIARGDLPELRRQASTEGNLEDAFLQLTAEEANV